MFSTAESCTYSPANPSQHTCEVGIIISILQMGKLSIYYVPGLVYALGLRLVSMRRSNGLESSDQVILPSRRTPYSSMISHLFLAVHHTL